jgi:hypothetical protein
VVSDPGNAVAAADYSTRTEPWQVIGALDRLGH